MSVNSVLSDGKQGFTATIDQYGSLQTSIRGTPTISVSGTVAVSGSVDASGSTVSLSVPSGGLETKPSGSSITRTTKTVTSSSATLVSPNSGRKQIQIQNQDASTSIFVRLDSTSATNSDYELKAGATYSFPPGVAYDGEIQAKSFSGSVGVLILEFM